MKTKKQYLFDLQQKFGIYSVNEFTKKCYDCALRHKDFFFDVLTGVVDQYYTEDSMNRERS